jgi:predicted AlkP superfamily pyrophosphatase or phosphodiesterase
LIDALGWEVAAQKNFFNTLFDRSAAMETVFGYSSAAIPSILTGTAPSEHGLWCMYSYAPDRSPFKFLRYAPWLPRRLHGRVKRAVRKIVDRRKIIKGYYDLYDIPLHYLKYFDVPQRGDPYLPGAGTPETIFDALKEKHIPYRVWEYRTDEQKNFRELVDSIGSDCRFHFLYTAELDALMHRVGTEHPDVNRKLEEYEMLLQQVMSKVNSQAGETIVYVFSDHGMTNVHSTIDVWGALDRMGLKFERDYYAFFDATLARFWVPTARREKLIEFLDRIEGGRVLLNDELRSLGCFFEDGSYGEIIFATHPGVMIVPSFMGKEPIAAMHGYHPDDLHSKACIMTNDMSRRLPYTITGLKDLFMSAIEGER